MAIWLIRHGETDLNAQRVLQHPSTPLSPRGEKQAAALAARLGAAPIDLVLSSDYARAHGTAAPLAAAARAPIELDPLLRERNFGALRGRAYADLGFDPFAPDFEPPEGESWAVFWERVDAAWVRLCARAASLERDLAVVTHGLVCARIVSRHLALPDDASAAKSPSGFGNTSVTEIEAVPPWRVRRLACVAHLAPDEVRNLGRA